MQPTTTDDEPNLTQILYFEHARTSPNLFYSSLSHMRTARDVPNGIRLHAIRLDLQ